MALPEARLALRRDVFAVGLAVSLAAGATPLHVAGQSFPPGPGPYDPHVPRVAAVRGFPTGTGFSTATDIGRVLEAIAAASPRVQLGHYGRTVEGRPLLLVWISAPENLARLAALRRSNVALASGEEPGSAAAERPIFVWLSFGIHGDEPAGPEAALELVYHLAATHDLATVHWLEHAVIVIDPLLNPDGHERYVSWYRSVSGERPDPNPASPEHQPPWPGARTNGLYFDLNRDWAWGVMPETHARWKVYLGTLPQVYVDFHEMDPTRPYFFFPPAPPIHPFLPRSTIAWASAFGAANAAAFRSRAWPFVTARDYDLLYPGYGDVWSSFLGATGMTYEQPGGPTAGLALSVGEGTLTLAERVERHLHAGLTTIGFATLRRAERLADFGRFWESGTRAPRDAPSAYVIPHGPGLSELAALLLAQGVRVEQAEEPVARQALVPLTDGVPVQSLPVGSLIVPTDQPLGRYAAALMDPRPRVDGPTTDVSEWALPYLFDVPVYATRDSLSVARRPWRPAGKPDVPAGTAALVWSYGSLESVLVALRMTGRGERVLVSDRTLVLGGGRWPPGSFVVETGSRAAALAAELGECGIVATPLDALPGRETGRFLRAVRPPRIAVAIGEEIRETSLGWVLHLLSRAGLRAAGVRFEELGDLALETYDVVVLPDGSDPSRYAARLAPALDRLVSWTAQGGTLVAVRGGAAALGLAEAGPYSSDATLAAENRRNGAGRAGDRPAGGVLLTAVIDTTSVLAYGFSDGQAAVMAWDPVPLEEGIGAVVWRFATNGPAGRLPGVLRGQLAGRPYAVVVQQGRGRTVLFADDPGFRAMAPTLGKLYLNALALMPDSGPPAAR